MKNSSKFNSLGGFPDLESFKDESGKYGYREKKTQKIFIAPQFDAAYSFHEGIAAVKVDHKYGYIDRHGLIVIKLDYDWASSFHNGLAMVERNNRYGYINQEGKEIVPIIYEHIDDFHEGLAPVKLNDKWGYVDC